MILKSLFKKIFLVLLEHVNNPEKHKVYNDNYIELTYLVRPAKLKTHELICSEPMPLTGGQPSNQRAVQLQPARPPPAHQGPGYRQGALRFSLFEKYIFWAALNCHGLGGE